MRRCSSASCGRLYSEGLVSLWFAAWRRDNLLLLLLAAFLLAMTARAFLLYARDR